MPYWTPPTVQHLLDSGVMMPALENDALRGAMSGNRDKNFVQRAQQFNPNVSNQIRYQGRPATHLMAYGDGQAFSTIEQHGSGLKMLPRGQRPQETIDFQSDPVASWFSKSYKRTNPNFGDY